MLKNNKPRRTLALFNTGTKVHRTSKGKGSYNRAKSKDSLRKEFQKVC